jgi:hypothetical protein
VNVEAVEAVEVDADIEDSATMWPAPSNSRYPITAEGSDAVVVAPVPVVVAPVPVVVVPVPVVPVPVVPVPVVVVEEASVWIEVGFRTNPYNPVRFESEHPFW